MSVSNLRRRLPSRQASETCSTLSTTKDVNPKSRKQDALDAEVREVFEQTLKMRTQSTQNISGLEILQEEAKRLTESVQAATRRDNENRKFNRNAQLKELICLLIGSICLLCPVLVLFDALLSYVPMVDVRSLEFASQQNDRLGQLSRFCVFIIRLADGMKIANRDCGGSYIAGCFGALFLILIFLHQTSSRRVILSPDQRKKLLRLQKVIQEELEKKSSQQDGLLHIS